MRSAQGKGALVRSRAARLDGGLRRGLRISLAIKHFITVSAGREGRPILRRGLLGLPDQGSRLTAQNRETFGEVGIVGPVPRGLEPPIRTVDEREPT